MTTFAGIYVGVVWFPGGRPAGNVSISVRPHGSGSLAALYTDNMKVTPAANPVTSDALGNLTFYADPGLYDFMTSWGAVYVDKVEPDPADAIGTPGSPGNPGLQGIPGPPGAPGSGGATLTITYTGGAYALRATVTASSTDAVTWIGPVAPTIGSGYLLPVDVWVNTGGSV